MYHNNPFLRVDKHGREVPRDSGLVWGDCEDHLLDPGSCGGPPIWESGWRKIMGQPGVGGLPGADGWGGVMALLALAWLVWPARKNRRAA